MKYSAFVIMMLIVTGCASKQNRADENPNSSNINYGDQLVDNGFLDFADTVARDTLKAALHQGFDIYDERTGKIVHVDAEELAEFNFDSFMPQLNKMLARRKFKLNVQVADDVEESHDVVVDGERIKLYTEKELEGGNFWDAASRNFFKEINKQLASQHVPESLYLLYGGNDLQAVLLTTSQHRIIAEKYKDEINEVPYLP